MSGWRSQSRVEGEANKEQEAHAPFLGCPGEHRAGGVEPMDAFAKPRRPVGGAGRGGALAAFAAPPANRITVGKGRWASVRQELVDVGIGTGEKLCGNQNFTARSC